MSDFHFVAVLTYGKEKHGNKSNFKLGRGAGPDVLLMLFSNHAREFVSPRASYRYINLDVKGATTYKNYLVLRVTPEENGQIEAICRGQGSYTWVYLWENETRRWLEFPCSPQAHYIDPSSYGGSCPKFVPTAAPFITPSKSVSESERTDEIGGLTFTQLGNWWWIAGDTYTHKDVLKQAGARWSAKRRQWYFKGKTLPQSIRSLGGTSEQRPAAAPERSFVASAASVRIENTTSDSTASSEPAHDDPRDVEATASQDPKSDVPAAIEPAVRVIKPESTPTSRGPDNIQFAIQQMKAAPGAVAQSCRIRQSIAQIPQEYVGELTGSISGNVHCYGYAVHQGICVYLNFGGPRMAIEAIRAKLGKGEMVNCVPWDGQAVELTAGEGNTGMYTDFMQNIPEARFTSVILLHEQVVAPLYGGKSQTFILCTDEAQAVAKLKYHITQLVTIPVFDAWADYLWDAGALASLVFKVRCAGGVDLRGVELDADAWVRLISGGLEQKVIALPSL